jgi:hypothetical protein
MKTNQLGKAWKKSPKGGYFRHVGIIGPCTATETGEITVLRGGKKYQSSATWIADALAALPARRVAFTAMARSCQITGVIDLPIGVTTAWHEKDAALTGCFTITGTTTSPVTHKLVHTGKVGDSPSPGVFYSSILDLLDA